jgi:DNA-binding transcriptional MerR regulator
MNLLTTKKAAAILGLTPDAVRYHERQGHILAIKVDRGQGEFQRLFVQEEIERFQRQREARELARDSHA